MFVPAAEKSAVSQSGGRGGWGRSLQRVCTCLLFGFVAVAQNNSPQAGQTPASSGQPAPIQTTITVNATISTESAASVTLLDQQQIQETPGINIDDRLRQVPGFSLFRRSSSVVANPTTQGVSLRGIGSSGASRTLVLWDGIPINDPFGGWVYWTRIDPSYIDRVEIDRGASTSVFGDRAMGGTISLFSPQDEFQGVSHEHVFANYFGGNEDTQDVSGAYSNAWGHWGMSVHSRAFTTDGYYITPEPVRGKVDDRANVRFATGDVDADYVGNADRFLLHFDVLAEERHNGTVLTHNSTGLGTVGATYSHSWTHDEISFLGFHTQEQYHSTYSSVAPDRDSEKLTSKQTVPSEDIGGALYWQHHGQNRQITWNTIAGADVDDTHGISYDYSYATKKLTPGGWNAARAWLVRTGGLQYGPGAFFCGHSPSIHGTAWRDVCQPEWRSRSGRGTVSFSRFRVSELSGAHAE